MASHYCIPLDAATEWSDALSGLRHGFGHTWENCYAMNLTTGFSTFLYVFESGDIRIVCPLAEREYSGYRDVVTPYGFSGFTGTSSCPGFSGYWNNFVGEKGYVCAYIGQNPVFEHKSYFSDKDIYHYNNIYVLDLSSDEDVLYRNLSENRRRQLRHWDFQSQYLTLDKVLLTEFFFENYHDFMRSKNAADVYSFSHETLLFLVGQELENVHMVGMLSDEKVVAVSVFAYTEDMGEYLFNVSLPEGRQHAVTLLWYGVKYLKKRNVRYFNLGGGVRIDDNVAEFKKRFGAMEVPLRSIKQVYRMDVYKELCEAADVDSGDYSGYFPGYRR